MRLRPFVTVIILLLMSVAFTPAVLAQQTTQVTCEDSLPSRLAPGIRASVTPGDPNRVRSLPSTESVLIGEIPGEGEFWVLHGPVCLEGFAWWYVQYEQLLGWTVEGGSNYWLEPLEDVTFAPVPVASKTISADFNNISFEYSDLVATGDVNAGIVPRMTEEDGGSPFEVAPEHTLFELTGYAVDPESRWSARVIVYPADEYEEMMTRPLEDLRAMIGDEQPDEPQHVQTQIVNAGLHQITQQQYVEFQNGIGVRAVLLYAQDLFLLTDQTLRYEFNGLTNDGKYLVFATFLLDSQRLPSQDWLWREELYYDGLLETFSDYSAASEMMLNSFPSSAFTPDLSELDALISSITVGDVGVTVTESDSGDSCETLRPRLIVDEMARQALAQDSLRVRAEPNGDATGENVFPGQLVTVLDGPVCANNVNWWQIVSPDGWTGWVGEAAGDNYFFDPITRTPTPTITPTPSITYTPSATATYRPYMTTTPWVTQCGVTPLADTTGRSLPDPESYGYLPLLQGHKYYAEAQYQRPGEDFPWWYVVPDVEFDHMGVHRWVRADFVTEEGDCEGLPIIPEETLYPEDRG